MFFAHRVLSCLALFLLVPPISVLLVGFRDRQLKSVAMITLNFFDGRSIESDSCSMNRCNPWPMHGGKARRMIPILREQFHPLRWWSPRKRERSGVKSTAIRAVIPWLCNVFDDHARNLDVLELREIGRASCRA